MSKIMIGVFLLMLLNGIAAYFFYGKWRMVSNERDEAVTISSGKSLEVKHLINRYNEEVVKAQAAQVSESNVKRLSETKELEYLKHIEGLRRSMKNFEHGSSIEASVKMPDSVLVPYEVPVADTSMHFFRWLVMDQYNMIDAVVLDTPVFEMKVPIRAVTYWERKRKFWFIRFGKKEYFTEAYSPNKLVKIDSVSSIVKRK